MKRMNYVKGFIVLMMLCFMLSACAQTEKPSHEKPDVESITVSFEHPETKQPFKIIHAYELFQNYTEKVESDPDRSPLDVYREEVIDPVYSACFENGEYINMAETVLNITPKQLKENQLLSEKIDREATEKSIKEGLFKSSEFLPTNNETTVCVFPATDVNANMVTIGAGKITALYNKYYTDESIRAIIAHEYYHSVATENRPRGEDKVLDHLIFEGRAVMFEKLVYPDLNFTRVDLDYNKVYWADVAADLDKPDLNRALDIIRGGNDLPYQYGYSEGYKMVKSYLDLHPNVSIEEWTALSPKEIFEKGNYLENYQ